MTYQYINTNQALADFCETIKDCKYCALDTEFSSEKTYYAILALIQLQTETAAACIDPLAIDDFSPLVMLFEQTDMVKILHASGQDLEIFHHEFDALPNPIFDTQIAAAVLGYANQIGYGDLVNRVCNVRLDKKYTRADWTKRPLSEGLLDYAMNDVRYLIDIYHALKNDLAEMNRLSWVLSDLEYLSNPAKYKLDMSKIWQKVKGSRRLKGQSLNVADQLSRWREMQAQKYNRPRRWILKDPDLVDIAKFQPKNERELKQIGALTPQFIGRNGKQIIEVVEQAATVDPKDYPVHQEYTKLSSNQKVLAHCLMGLGEDIAKKNNIALASVTTKKEIDQLVTGRRDLSLTSGWRNEILGQHLINFLEGDIQLSCIDGRLKY